MTQPRTVLITGTSRGLGRSVAVGLLEREDVVYGCSRGASTIEHANYSHYTVDLSDDAQVKSMFAEIIRKGLGLQAVINNAGVDQAKLAVFTGAAEAEQILKTNILAPFLVTREAVKLMKRGRFGRVLYFSSINARLGSAGSVLYNASKAALEVMALSMGREFGADNITFNALGLSLVAGTGMADSLSASAAQSKTQNLSKPSPLQIDEILHAIEFFLAAEARNITGQTLYFGGL